MLQLFDFELPENTEPVDETRIQLVNFYFSQAEKARFNELCKKGMVSFYGEKAKESNALDFLLELLEREFGTGEKPVKLPYTIDTKKIVEALEIAKAEINKLEEQFNGTDNG